LVGHGVDAEPLRQAARRWFAQPLHEKRKVNAGASGYGVAPFVHMDENAAQLLGDFSRPKDSVESLTFHNLGTACGRGRLPAFGGLSTAMLAYNDALQPLRTRLAEVCEVGLGVDRGFFAAHGCQTGGGGAEGVRLALYPDEPCAPGQMRYGEHVDSYGITLLSVDPHAPEGLEVKVGGDFFPVPFVPGSMVLNVGALLSRWTNGTWKAAIHRVVSSPGSRLSIVSGALRPAEDALIEPMPLGESRFPPILARDFFEERVAMHRPTYLEETGHVAEDVSNEIQTYQR